MYQPLDTYTTQPRFNGVMRDDGEHIAKSFEEIAPSYWESEGPIVQEIPDNLMVGDYIEINGICRGPEVTVELITEDQRSGTRNDVLPLHIQLLAGGPVLVKNYSKDKVERQEYNHRMPLQQNQSFQLCIYALEDCYEIKLNGQTVCKHKHVVNLENVSAITMDGDADFTSIEFKDTSCEDPELVYVGDAPQPGLMRVQEMRDSITRKPGSPQFVRSSVRRSQRSGKLDTSASMGKSGDYSRPNIDIDTSQRHTMAATGYGVSTDPDTSPKTRKRSSVLPSRKSIQLDEGKLEDYSVVGGSQSRAIAGDAHRGEYRTLDDETRPITRQLAQTMYVESGSMNASAVSLQEKKKKRSSLFGSKSRKSKGSESDLSMMGTEKEKKVKGSRGHLRSKKGATVSENDLRMSTSIADTNWASSGSVFEPSYSSRVNYVGVGADRAPVRGPIPKSVAKQPAAEMAAYMAGQKAVPEFDSFTYTNCEDPNRYNESRSRVTSNIYVDEPTFQPVSRSMYDPTMTSAVIQPTPRKKEGPIYLGVGAERSPVPGPMPKSVLKQPAPVMASYVAGQKAVPEFEDFTYVGPIFAEAYPEQRTLKESAPPRTSMAASRELEGTPAEKADILYKNGRASFDPNVNLTGGMQNQVYRAPDVESMYADIDPRAGTMPPQTTTVVTTSKPTKLKGPAPEMAAELQDAHHNRMKHLPETSLAGDISTQRPKSIGRPAYDIDPVIVKPRYAEPESIRPVEVSRSSSVPYHNSYRDDDKDSVVLSDNEFYLSVSKSDYFLDRQRSLKNYKSKRSRQKEREARRSMGFSNHTDSARSSISSFTEEDFRGRTIYPRKGRTEPPVYQRRDQNTKVYAEPPMIEPLVQPKPKFELNTFELKNGRFGTKFPHALTPGRSAHLAGHFLHDRNSKLPCTIRLWTDELTDASEFSAVTVNLSPTGELTVHGTKNTNPTSLLTWKGKDAANNLIDPRMFTLTLHARGASSALTVNEFITLWLPSGFDPVKLNHLELETPNSAELDYFAVTPNLALPVDLTFPVQSHRDETQTATLKTKMTADTTLVSAQFITQTNKSFTVKFAFDKDRVYISPDENDSKPINLVPEQIREIKIKRCMMENTISVMANGTELLNQPLAVTRPVGKLSRIRITGQFTLLDAELH